MANEWVKVVLYGQNNDGEQRSLVVADGVTISKGTLLQLIDPRTAVIASGAFAPCAGVAAMEKEANDGRLTISAWLDGEFDAVASGAIGVGQPIIMAENNMIKLATTGASGAHVIGYALETATDAEKINVRLTL